MTTKTAPRTLVETETPGWFLDPNTGKKARKTKIDKVISQVEYEHALQGSPQTTAGPKIFVSDTGKALIGPTTTIQCVECGAERVVKVQDAFQVERCAKHQREHRNRRRREKRAAIKAAKTG